MSWKRSFWKTILPAVTARVPADLEGRHVSLTDFQEIAGLLHVLDELTHALNEVLGVRGKGLAHHFWVGHRKVRGRERAREQAERELRLLSRALVETVGPVQQILRPVRREKIGLHPKIEIGIRRPLRIPEAVVGGLGLDDRIDALSHKTADRVVPQIHIRASEPPLRHCEHGWVCHPHAEEDVGNRLRRLGHFACPRIRANLRVRAREHAEHGTLDLFEEAQHVARELLGIVDRVGSRRRGGVPVLHRETTSKHRSRSRSRNQVRD